MTKSETYMPAMSISKNPGGKQPSESNPQTSVALSGFVLPGSCQVPAFILPATTQTPAVHAMKTNKVSLSPPTGAMNIFTSSSQPSMPNALPSAATGNIPVPALHASVSSGNALAEVLDLDAKMTGSAPGPTSTPNRVGWGNVFRRARTWDESYEELKKYKARYGTLKFARKDKQYRNLCTWVSYQRNNQTKLSKEKFEKLKAIGFDFETQAMKKGKHWEEMFELYKAHIKWQGDDDDVRMEQPLRRWAGDQRYYYHGGRLLEERFKKLKAIGFDFQVKENPQAEKQTFSKMDEQWLGHYQNLCTFVERFGHCLIPQHIPTLGTWVMNQRSLKRKNKLPKAREKLLDKQMFIWDVDDFLSSEDGKWVADLQRVLRCKEDFGHISSSVLPYDLRVWVAQQKLLGMREKLNHNRARVLVRELGIFWVESNALWEKKFSMMKNEYEELDSKTCESNRTVPKIENWLDMQALMEETQNLDQERKQKLVEYLGKRSGMPDEELGQKTLKDILQVVRQDPKPVTKFSFVVGNIHKGRRTTTTKKRQLNDMSIEPSIGTEPGGHGFSSKPAKKQKRKLPLSSADRAVSAAQQSSAAASNERDTIEKFKLKKIEADWEESDSLGTDVVKSATIASPTKKARWEEGQKEEGDRHDNDSNIEDQDGSDDEDEYMII